MNGKKWHDYLREGLVDQALTEARLEHPKNRAKMTLSIGAIYMWSRKYRSALDVFEEAIKSPPGERAGGVADVDHGMAGTASWCLEQSGLALDHWRRGMNTPYAIAGANTRTALLLYTASILAPELLSRETAEQLLVEKSHEWNFKHWPGPIAAFVLGTISQEEAMERGSVRNRGTLGATAHWQLKFYGMMRAAAAGKLDAVNLEKEMRLALGKPVQPCLEGREFFYFLRCEEFYLARHFSRS